MEAGIYQQVLNGELDLESDPWPSISESAKDLLRGMLVRNTKKRMTASQVLSEYQLFKLSNFFGYTIFFFIYFEFPILYSHVM